MQCPVPVVNHARSASLSMAVRPGNRRTRRGGSERDIRLQD
jgi:hypothetical protein